jgi:hypothetical protein
VAEAPISCVYEEKAKRNPVSQAAQVLTGVLELVSESRPLFFFGLSGLLATIAGVGLWLWILQTYREPTNWTLGYALIALLLIVLGVSALLQGVTLHMLRKMMHRLPPEDVEHFAQNASQLSRGPEDRLEQAA